MAYNPNSLDRFVQKQGGTLQNLGASPTYTGAPAKAGTPAGQIAPQQQPYQQSMAPRGPQPMGGAPQGAMPPQAGIQSLGAPPGQSPMQPQAQRPGMGPPGGQPGQMPQQNNVPLSRGVPPQLAQALQDPQKRAKIMEIIRQRMMNQPNRGNMSRLGAPRGPVNA